MFLCHRSIFLVLVPHGTASNRCRQSQTLRHEERCIFQNCMFPLDDISQLWHHILDFKHHRHQIFHQLPAAFAETFGRWQASTSIFTMWTLFRMRGKGGAKDPEFAEEICACMRYLSFSHATSLLNHMPLRDVLFNISLPIKSSYCRSCAISRVYCIFCGWRFLHMWRVVTKYSHHDVLSFFHLRWPNRQDSTHFYHRGCLHWRGSRGCSSCLSRQELFGVIHWKVVVWSSIAAYL